MQTLGDNKALKEKFFKFFLNLSRLYSMTKEFLLTTLGINDTRLIPEALMEVLFGDQANRHKFYRAMLEANDFAMDREWFQPIYEAELSERGQKKQDFTPAAASQLAAMITDNGARRQGILEPTAGNGSMIIAKWWELCRKRIPFDYYPNDNPVECWELSDRSIPILLFNLSVRGMVGDVYHGDVLEQRVIEHYRLINKRNDALGFSEIFKLS